jgi:hypothetical protein
MRNKKLNAERAAVALGKFFIFKKKIYTEEEYKTTSRFKTPFKYTTLIRLFKTYDSMLEELDKSIYAKEIKALKPKPKPIPKVEAPKAPAKPKKVEPAKAKGGKDE